MRGERSSSEKEIVAGFCVWIPCCTGYVPRGLAHAVRVCRFIALVISVSMETRQLLNSPHKCKLFLHVCKEKFGCWILLFLCSVAIVYIFCFHSALYLIFLIIHMCVSVRCTVCVCTCVCACVTKSSVCFTVCLLWSCNLIFHIMCAFYCKIEILLHASCLDYFHFCSLKICKALWVF